MVRTLRGRHGWLTLFAWLALTHTAAADEPDLHSTKNHHWAWQQPVRPLVPALRAGTWVRNPLDAFILAKLEAAGLHPTPPATREVLLRRVTFDLIGLPPTPAEIDAFANDRAPDAWDKVIDRLLASPHYGERWGRHWLDLARFAESNGYEFDEIRPDAWRYRDYVIAAFNEDKPYDRFIREQLAGDQLYPHDPAALIATGFNLLGPDMTDASDQTQRRQNTLNDMTDTASLVFLGLTIGCCRCHDHKFEPLPQTDYYRLQAFFAPADFRRDLPIAGTAVRVAHDRELRDYTALVRPLQQEMGQLEQPYRQKLRAERLATLSDEAQAAHRMPAAQRSPSQKALVEKTARLVEVSAESVVHALSAADRVRHQALLAKLKQFDDRKPVPLPVALGLLDSTTMVRTYLLERGDLSNPGEEVQPGFPIVLTRGKKILARRRAVLAEWIARPENPLTARVLVNRIWQHHFGRGLVATTSDFGVHGRRPSHPELLDWLATEFTAHGWSIKYVHRLLLTSATYQQATKPAAGTSVADPANELLSHMHRLRLEGEAIRDSLLALSGRLNSRMGGPGVFPPIPDEALRNTRNWVVSPDPRDHVRRSVYIFARRNLRYPFLEAFDVPDSNLSCPRRERSTTAPQALTLLNDADVVGAACALAARLGRDATTETDRVTLAYRVTLGRRPSAAELVLARDFLVHAPLSELCRALCNVNEFIYLD